MMKRLLLTTSTAALLMAGASLAVAQQKEQPMQGGAANQSTMSQQGQSGAAAGDQLKEKSRTGASNEQMKEKQGTKTGEAAQGTKRTTGQAEEKPVTGQGRTTAESAQERQTGQAEQKPMTGQGKTTAQSAQERQTGKTGKTGEAAQTEEQQPGTTSKHRTTTGQASQERMQGQGQQERMQGQASQERMKGQERTQGQANQERMQGKANQERMQGTERREATGQAGKEGQTAQGRTGQEQTKGQAENGNLPRNMKSMSARAKGEFNMAPQKAAEFHDRVMRVASKETTNVNFNVSVGVVVPESVTIEPLPADIIAEYPEFRGYDFVVVRDEIVIIQPKTRKVVEVITSTGGPSYSKTETRLHLSAKQREEIRRSIRAKPSSFEFTESVGAMLPTDVELVPMPETVITEVPEVRSYDYVVTRDDHIVIVDPNSREAVDVID